jgi:hypothetical protein
MEYLSLYDYLGKPAGSELGQEVAAASRNAGITLKSREVENPKYKGAILLYPKDFLEFYFREPTTEHPPFSTVDEDDDLPF